MPERIVTNIMEIKLIVLMLIAWTSRLALSSNITLGTIIRQLIISIFVGVMAASYFLTSPFEDWLNTTLFCIAIFLADDIVVILLAFGTYAKVNQEKIFKHISNKWVGK